MNKKSLLDKNLQRAYFEKALKSLNKKALVAYMYATCKLHKTQRDLTIFVGMRFPMYWKELRYTIINYELGRTIKFSEFRNIFTRLQLFYTNEDHYELATHIAEEAKKNPDKEQLYELLLDNLIE